MARGNDDGFYKKVLDSVYDGVYFIDRDRRITYWNRGAERIAGYTADEVIGTRCMDNLLMHTDADGVQLCETACPATSSMERVELCEAEVFLHHRDGHRVPIVTHISPLLRPDGEVAGAVEVFTDNTAMLRARERIRGLEHMALIDELTGIGNRRHAETHLQARLDGLERYGWPFGLLFYDIDNFKLVNDSYGHEVGDDVLTMVARSTSGAVRSFDTVSRWGGEEFTAIVENVDDTLVGGVGEKVRSLVEQSSIHRNGDRITVTISVGATLARAGDTIETLVGRADSLMYASKNAGRNRVTTG